MRVKNGLVNNKSYQKSSSKHRITIKIQIKNQQNIKRGKNILKSTLNFLQ